MAQKQLSEYSERPVIGIPFIWSISSLNLRMGRGDMRVLNEPIEYKCSICNKGRMLGKDCAVLVKMEVDVGRGKELLHLCDICVDVLSEAIRFGPRVIDEVRTWKLSTRVARVSVVQDELVCFKCMGRASSHMFVKYDDFSGKGGVGVNNQSCSYGSIRVCARCTLSYLEMLRVSKVMRRNKVKECCVDQSVPCRAWKSIAVKVHG